MPRSLALGNGNMLVCLDKHAQVRDFYFPYVGLENHVGGHNVHRVGVFADGVLEWLDNPEWRMDIGCGSETFASDVVARSDALSAAHRP